MFEITEEAVAKPDACGRVDCKFFSAVAGKCLLTGPACVFSSRPIVGEQLAALEQQVGGDHYKSMAIQPVEYIHRNGIGFCEGSVIKYVSRWRSKGGIEDLKKARHFLDLLIDMEESHAVSS